MMIFAKSQNRKIARSQDLGASARNRRMRPGRVSCVDKPKCLAVASRSRSHPFRFAGCADSVILWSCDFVISRKSQNHKITESAQPENRKGWGRDQPATVAHFGSSTQETRPGRIRRLRTGAARSCDLVILWFRENHHFLREFIFIRPNSTHFEQNRHF